MLVELSAGLLKVVQFGKTIGADSVVKLVSEQPVALPAELVGITVTKYVVE